MQLVPFDFSVAFDRVSHCALLYKLRVIGVGGQFLSIVSEVLSDRRQRVCMDKKVSASVDVVSRVTQGNVLEQLLFILSTSKLFRIVWNRIVGYTDDATI